jgi:hypothetical protein
MLLFIDLAREKKCGREKKNIVISIPSFLYIINKREKEKRE